MHKVFISHYHADHSAVNNFIEKFGKGSDKVFIPKIVGDDYDTSINSDNSEYIMRVIREDYLADSTVTIVLIGDETYKRKYVDWEVAATLRNDFKNKRSGLIGIRLPGQTESNTVTPYRLQDNVDSGYAKVYSYTSDASTLERWLDEAWERKEYESNKVNNTRPLFKYNRS